MEYSEITRKHMESLSLTQRKPLGQYMTPPDIADILANSLHIDKEEYSPVVLDPSVGTGELLLAVERLLGKGNFKPLGFDIDSGMLKAAGQNLPNGDFEEVSLFTPAWRKYEGTIDYIIGNPPYFELKKDDPRLSNILDFAILQERGRLNIYSLFFEYALRLLKIGGRMTFLVPPSMNNGAYFKELRKTILKYGAIEKVEILRDNKLFSDALTSVQIIVIQRTNDTYEKNWNASSKFLFGDPQSFIITDDKIALDKFWEEKQSLEALGFEVKTGNIPWNQYKDKFVASREEGDVLYYAKDISSENKIVLSSNIPNERRFLDKNIQKQITEPAILVNRIVGSLSNPKLRFAYLENESFFAENHVNVITATKTARMTLPQLYEALKAIPASELGKYLNTVTGNTQLSRTELLRLLPIIVTNS